MPLVKRKPVPPPRLDEKVIIDDVQPRKPSDSELPKYEDIKDASAFENLTTVESPIQEGEARPDLEEQLEHLELETISEPEGFHHLGGPHFHEQSASASNTSGSAQTLSVFKTAFNEVKHFAGGLVGHPFEATKHYTIIRHSHGLVYYKGPTTNVAITILSDRPLPADRKLWLQKRGFSGRTGMAVGTLWTRSAWIDVTPAVESSADLLPKDDERAWQRDIAKFIKKARNTKPLNKHRPYETDVIRIPHVADDGYFRIVLCAGRKVLCPSPTFRYASSSLDPSTVRGASLSTLPMELGIKVGAFVARHAANTAAHGAMQPALTTAQSISQQYNLSNIQSYATAAYDASGAANKVSSTFASANSRYDEKRDLAYRTVGGDAMADANIVGSDDGPEQPFPIRFSGIVTRGAGKGRVWLGVPTAKLVGVPDETMLRLMGVYMGCVSVSKAKISKEKNTPEDLYRTWYHAVVMVDPVRDQPAKVVEDKTISVYILHDFGDIMFFEARLKVMLMAYLRPPSQDGSDIEQLQHRMALDIATTKLSLDRPNWGADLTLERLKSESSNRSITERLADVRSTGQKQLDKIPAYKLGVRVDSMGRKDQLIGNGGICVRR